MKSIKLIFPVSKKELQRQNEEIRTRLEAQERQAKQTNIRLKAFENMSMEEFGKALGGNKENEIDERTAMENVALADAGVRYLSRKLSTMELQLVKVNPKTGASEIIEDNYSRLLARPNFAQSWHDLFRSLYFNLNVYGIAFIAAPLMPNPVRLWSLPAGNMTRVAPVDTLTPATEYELSIDMFPDIGRRFKRYSADDLSGKNRGRNLIVFQNQSPISQFEHVPILKPILKQLIVLQEMQDYQNSLFRNMPGLSGVMYLKDIGLISDDEFERMQAQIAASMTSSRNAGKIAFVPDATKFEKYDMDWNKLGLEGCKQLTEADVLAALGIPSELWGDVSGQSTYNNKETALKMLYIITLIPFMIEFLATLNNFFYPEGDRRFEINIKTTPYYLEFCKAVDALQSLTLNEKRRMIGYPPIDGGDVIIINGVALPEILGGGQKLQL